MVKPGSRPLPELAQAFEQAVNFYREGRLDEAEKIASRILKAMPASFDALHFLGLVRLKQGKAGAALGLIEKALAINPGSAPAHCNLGLVLAALNRDAEALASFDRSLVLAPDAVDTLNNRGTLLLKLNRPADAVAVFDRVATLEPRHLGARINRGNALAAMGRLDEALAQYDALLATIENVPDIHFNRGNALSELGRQGEAVAAFDRALALQPGNPKAHLNRGNALQALNRHQEAIASFAKVQDILKGNADAQHNAALSLLTLGDYGRGFAQHEARWQRAGMPARRRNFGKPLWLGEFPPGRKTILLHAEQGLGDTIQFVRYASLLARMGAKVVLEVPPELKALLARVEGVAAVVGRGEALPEFDLHCPMGSLPLACRTDLSSIPADIPYLKASDEHVAKWRARLDGLAPPRIAIAWSGRAAHANDRNRSIALARLAPLLSLDQVRFISIQRDMRDADTATLARLPQLTHVGPELADFDDTAALASLVDLVIAVDTSVVHLAAALRRPTWILVPFHPDWRWMLDRQDSPWYPTARLFRQPAPGDWDSVIASVRDELMRDIGGLRRD